MQSLRPSIIIDSPPTARSLSTATQSRVNSSNRISKDLMLFDADRSGASSAFKLDNQELLEQVYRDNRQLRKQMTELEQSREDIQSGYQRMMSQLKRTYESKVTSLERAIAEKDETIRGLKTKVVCLQASHVSKAAPVQNFEKVDQLLDGMRDKITTLTLATAENYQLVREQLDMIDGAEMEIGEREWEPSSIQEEASVKPVRSTRILQRKQSVLSILDNEISIETNRLSTVPQEDTCISLDSVATPDLRNEVHKQRSLIRKHEAFIKQLKSTLEALLKERIGSKDPSQEWCQELRSLLQMDESIRSHCGPPE